jgi:hypothetical protein
MTKKPIDITGKLPPVHVRKPWRQQLPKVQAKRIDDLMAAQRSLQSTYNNLRVIEQEFAQAVRDGGEISYGPQGTYLLDCQRKEVANCMVLLECALEKLEHTIPIEETMPEKDLAELMGIR